jgi:hypothetical protein
VTRKFNGVFYCVFVHPTINTVNLVNSGVQRNALGRYPRTNAFRVNGLALKENTILEDLMLQPTKIRSYLSAAVTAT